MNSAGLGELVDMAVMTVDKAMGTPSERKDPRLITIGCVMTNQARKDWGLWAAIARDLIGKLPNIRFWVHVDTLVRTWSIEALVADYALAQHVEITLPPIDDSELARRYRMCDLTILPSLGEGFGYPWAESVACGVPCIHGNYGGGADLMRTCGLAEWLVWADWDRLETQHNCIRPVYDAGKWVNAIVGHLDARQGAIDPISQHVDHLSWDKLKHPWRRWLRDGLVLR